MTFIFPDNCVITVSFAICRAICVHYCGRLFSSCVLSRDMHRFGSSFCHDARPCFVLRKHASTCLNSSPVSNFASMSPVDSCFPLSTHVSRRYKTLLYFPFGRSLRSKRRTIICRLAPSNRLQPGVSN